MVDRRGADLFSAGAAEAAWKRRVASGGPAGREVSGRHSVLLEFVLAERALGRRSVDLDSLCEPLLSVLVNKRGWFSGERPGVQSMVARKCADPAPGCRVNVSDDLALEDGALGHPRFRGRYPGPRLPRRETLWSQTGSPRRRRASEKLRSLSPWRSTPRACTLGHCLRPCQERHRRALATDRRNGRGARGRPRESALGLEAVAATRTPIVGVTITVWDRASVGLER